MRREQTGNWGVHGGMPPLPPFEYDCADIERWTKNPFYVLELATDVSWSEIEQRARALTEGCARHESDSYPTPFGRRRRRAGDVAAALEALRDPDRRIMHELWATLPARNDSGEYDLGSEDAMSGSWVHERGWRSAMTAFGWRNR